MLLMIMLLFLLAGFGTGISQQKRRSQSEVFLLGFLFGPLGCLVEAVLPEGARPIPIYGRPRPATNAVAASTGKDFLKRAVGHLDKDHPDWRRSRPERLASLIRPYETDLTLVSRINRSVNGQLHLNPDFP